MTTTRFHHHDSESPEALTIQLAALLPPGIIGCVERICDGDEAFAPRLLDGSSIPGVAQARRASGAGRRAVARLMAQLAPAPPAPVPRGVGGLPVWPPGMLGSIAHDAAYACAVLCAAPADPCRAPADACRAPAYTGLGVDIEPAQPLEDDVARLVASPDERRAFGGAPCGTRALFVIKEAVFKATYPHDLKFLDFPDIQVDRERQTARVSTGREIQWRIFAEHRIIAAAWW